MIEILYQHYKGGFYIKLFKAKDSNDCLKERVIYLSLQKTDFPIFQLWDRENEKFEDGRFKKVSLLYILKNIIKNKRDRKSSN